MSESQFNKMVRPFIVEIKEGRMISYDRLDLDAWADEYKAANGRPGKEMKQWENKPRVFESAGKSRTLIRRSPESSYEKAVEKWKATKQKETPKKG